MGNVIKFGGKNFYRQRNGYYKGNRGWLHIVVWESANGKVPEGCEIHHRDFNPENNALENLQCLTKAEHVQIHTANRPVHSHTCENCGRSYEAKNYNSQNRFCSKTCRIAFLRKQGYYDVEKVCEFCGRTFTTRKDRKARFCSNSCAKKANPNKHRADGQFTKTGEAGSSCLTEEQKSWIRSVYKPYDREFGITALARKLGVHRVTIGRLLCKND